MAKEEALPFSLVEFKSSTDKKRFDNLGDLTIFAQQEIEKQQEKIETYKEEMKKIAKRNNLPKSFFGTLWRYNYITQVRERINKIKLLEAGIKATIIAKCTDHSVSEYVRVSSNQKKEKNGSED